MINLPKFRLDNRDVKDYCQIASKLGSASDPSLGVNLSVLCASAVTASLPPLNRKAAEDAEVSAERGSN
jgi:hypothetical protein